MSRPQAPLRSWATAGAFHPPVTGARALLTRSGIHRMCDCVSTRQLASSTQRESRWKGVLEASGEAVTLESCSTSSINSSTQIGTELLTFDEFETRWSLQCYTTYNTRLTSQGRIMHEWNSRSQFEVRLTQLFLQSGFVCEKIFTQSSLFLQNLLQLLNALVTLTKKNHKIFKIFSGK